MHQPIAEIIKSFSLDNDGKGLFCTIASPQPPSDTKSKKRKMERESVCVHVLTLGGGGGGGGGRGHKVTVAIAIQGSVHASALRAMSHKCHKCHVLSMPFFSFAPTPSAHPSPITHHPSPITHRLPIPVVTNGQRLGAKRDAGVAKESIAHGRLQLVPPATLSRVNKQHNGGAHVGVIVAVCKHAQLAAAAGGGAGAGAAGAGAGAGGG